MKKYKLKLDYTADELKELKELSKTYNSPMFAVWTVVGLGNYNDLFRNLQKKCEMLETNKEFDFMADINNVVMGTAIFPNKLYIAHDTNTNSVIYRLPFQEGNIATDWTPALEDVQIPKRNGWQLTQHTHQC